MLTRIGKRYRNSGSAATKKSNPIRAPSAGFLPPIHGEAPGCYACELEERRRLHHRSCGLQRGSQEEISGRLEGVEAVSADRQTAEIGIDGINGIQKRAYRITGLTGFGLPFYRSTGALVGQSCPSCYPVKRRAERRRGTLPEGQGFTP